MDNGFITLHRQITQWEWYQNINTSMLFIHLLLMANHKDQKWQGVTIKRGQRVTSYQHLADETGLTYQKVRTALNNLKSTGEITYESTNKYSVITIVNYDKYQTKKEKLTGKTTGKLTPKQQSNNNQITTNNNENNVNNENNKDINISDEILVETSEGEITTSEIDPKEIGRIINEFQHVNPSYKNLFARKVQRSAVERMLKEHGEKKVNWLLQAMTESAGSKYAPMITTPLQLEEKMGSLISFYKRSESGSKVAKIEL